MTKILSLRIASHKVFAGLAKRSKSSMGWFFGFKLHLVINEKGEIQSALLTAGNVDDRVHVDDLTKRLKGLLLGDKASNLCLSNCINVV